MVRTVDSTSDARMEEKKHFEIGCDERKHWKRRNNSLESTAGHGENVEEMDLGAVTLVVDLAKTVD